MSNSMEYEKQPLDESNSQAYRPKRRVSIVFKLNIIFGIMMLASVIAGIILQSREISGKNILDAVLIITFVLGIFGIVITNAVHRVTLAAAKVKSVVNDLKNS